MTADLRPVLPDQGLVLLIQHAVDAAAQGIPARTGKECLELAAVFGLNHLPAHVLEEPLQAGGPDAGHDTVQALAVEVHDPQQVVNPLQGVVQECLPDVALVHLGIPHQGDKAPLGQGSEMGLGVSVDGGSKGGRHGPEPHRPRRKINTVGILRPAGIGLEAPVGTKPCHVLAGKTPQQILDGVEGRRRLRLDRDPVSRSQIVEIQGRQDRGDGGGGSLVASDFRPLGVGSFMVGVVDHPAGQPHDPPLDGLQGYNLFGGGGEERFLDDSFLLRARAHGIPPRRCKVQVRRRRAASGEGVTERGQPHKKRPPRRPNVSVNTVIILVELRGIEPLAS